MKSGVLSSTSSHELSWTVLDLKRSPPSSRCCDHCNPQLLDWCKPSNSHDPRILKYAAEFIHLLPPPPSRPLSRTSVISDLGTVASQDSVDFKPVQGKQTVSKEDKDSLRILLVKWRKERHFRMGNSPYLPCEVVLPPKQLEKLVASCGTFLNHTLVQPKHIQKVVAWEMAPASDVSEVCDVIASWRITLEIPRTPQSRRRPRKRGRQTPVPPTPQPVFTPVPSSSQPLPSPRTSGAARQGTFRARGTPTQPSVSNRTRPATYPTPLSTPQAATPSYDDFFSSLTSSRTFTPRSSLLAASLIPSTPTAGASSYQSI